MLVRDAQLYGHKEASLGIDVKAYVALAILWLNLLIECINQVLLST